GAAAIARASGAGHWLATSHARRLVFVDGSFVAELSDLAALEPGLTITSMAAALGAGDPRVTGRVGRIVPSEDGAVALNTAFMGDGAVIHIAGGTRVQRPLHLVFAYRAERASAVFCRSLVDIEDKAHVTIVESHEGPDGLDYQINAALDVAIAQE